MNADLLIEVRRFLASPFLFAAKVTAWIAAKIEGNDVVCFAMREAIEITESNIEQLISEIEIENSSNDE